jgi:2-keto-3-deoxy-L-rhamnonate aldolase RhmA
MNFKQKLKNREVTIGSWLSIANTAVAEIMAKAGVDWLAIDMEHSSLSVDQCQELIRVIDLCGVAPLVRVGANDPLLIKRAMDAGARGVIVPMVNSAQDAIAAVHAVKYPPRGTRGVGLARAQGYGTTFDKYIKESDRESVVIIQIEHKDALENLENIFSVEGVDGFIVGPYDLSASLGVAGDFKSEKMRQALSRIEKTAKEKNIPSGYHVVFPDPGLVNEKIKEGYTFIAYSVDFLLLGESFRQGLKAIKR